MTEYTCSYCLKMFVRVSRERKPRETRFCSRSCGGKYYQPTIQAASVQNKTANRDVIDLPCDNLFTSYIPLTRGKYALVSSQDRSWVERYNWCVLGEHGYAGRFISKGLPVKRMHREVLERLLGRALSRHELVDHINHDTLDNRRENLRLADNSQNHGNQRLTSRNTSGHKGIFWEADRRKWRTTIRYRGLAIIIGRFEERQEAAWFYDQWAIALHGDYALTNFLYK